jgi:hypothetical protein
MTESPGSSRPTAGDDRARDWRIWAQVITTLGTPPSTGPAALAAAAESIAAVAGARVVGS